MFHVKHFYILLFLFLPLLGQSQAFFSLTDQPFQFDCPTDSTIIQWVTKETNRVSGSTKDETAFFYWVNYVRQHPLLFRDYILQPFLDQFPETNGKEAASLKTELSSERYRPLLQYNLMLHGATLNQANDIVNTGGQLSHYSSKGLSFAQRMKIAGVTGCASENLYTGKNDPLLALIMLLLDLGLTPPGHRNNILNPAFLSMAVRIRANKHDESVVLVQQFGCR